MKEKERLRRVRTFNATNEEWICPHYVIRVTFQNETTKDTQSPKKTKKKTKKNFWTLSFTIEKKRTLSLFLPAFPRFSLSLSLFSRSLHSFITLFFFFLPSSSSEREGKKERGKERDVVRKFEKSE